MNLIVAAAGVHTGGGLQALHHGCATHVEGIVASTETDVEVAQAVIVDARCPGRQQQLTAQGAGIEIGGSNHMAAQRALEAELVDMRRDLTQFVVAGLRQRAIRIQVVRVEQGVEGRIQVVAQLRRVGRPGDRSCDAAVKSEMERAAGYGAQVEELHRIDQWCHRALARRHAADVDRQGVTRRVVAAQQGGGPDRDLGLGVAR